MDYKNKPSVFVFGEKKPDAQPEPQIMREELAQYIKEVRKYIRESKIYQI